MVLVEFPFYGSTAPVEGEHQSRHDVPDAPPGGNEGHSSQAQLGGEDAGIKNQCQSESGVLDTGLDGDGPAVQLIRPEEARQDVSAEKGQPVVDEHQQEGEVNVAEEDAEV